MKGKIKCLKLTHTSPKLKQIIPMKSKSGACLPPLLLIAVLLMIV
nr:MAG TPA: hypothetical protein [Bacteriophage sp.]